MGSNRGSRMSDLASGTTERFLETAFLEESSAGACLDGRAKSRTSFLPALRSSASPNAWPDRKRLFGCEMSVSGRLRLARDSWALARAPKEIIAASLSLAGEDSADSDYGDN